MSKIGTLEILLLPHKNADDPRHARDRRGNRRPMCPRSSTEVAGSGRAELRNGRAEPIWPQSRVETASSR